MSVRERACQNRYLDMKEKDIKYKQHVNLIRTCKSTIDMKQPVMSHRHQLMMRNEAVVREKKLKMFAENDMMILEAKRPQTAAFTSPINKIQIFQPKSRPLSRSGRNNEMELFRKQYNKSGVSNSDTNTESFFEGESDHARIFSLGGQRGKMNGDNEKIRIGTFSHEEKEKILVETDKGSDHQSLVIPSEQTSDNEEFVSKPPSRRNTRSNSPKK